MKIICLSGIDGSGKSTLASELSSELTDSKGYESYNTNWLGWKEFRTTPFRQIAKMYKYGSNYFGDTIEVNKVDNSEADHPLDLFTSRLFLLLILIDHILLVYTVYIKTLITSENIVADRYYYDIIVSFSAKRGDKINKYKNLLALLKIIYPTPNQALIIDVTPDVSLQRKSDIPNKQFIVNRRRLYIELARMKEIPVVNNNKKLDQTVSKIKKIVNERD